MLMDYIFLGNKMSWLSLAGWAPLLLVLFCI